MHGQILAYIPGARLDHAWHVGCQNLIEVLVIAQLLDHLGRDDGYGRGRLVDALTLIGGRGDGGYLPLTELGDHIDESRRVFSGGTVIGILLEH